MECRCEGGCSRALVHPDERSQREHLLAMRDAQPKVARDLGDGRREARHDVRLHEAVMRAQSPSFVLDDHTRFAIGDILAA